MHMIVVGCGRVGSTVARELSNTGHDVVVIDRNADAFRRLGDDFTGRTVVGIGFDREVLLSAGITASSAVVAVTNGALDFGPWEQIFYGEFDGLRRKRVLVKIIGE